MNTSENTGQTSPTNLTQHESVHVRAFSHFEIKLAKKIDWIKSKCNIAIVHLVPVQSLRSEMDMVRPSFLTLLVLLSTISTLVRSQAPNDFHEECTRDPVPDGVVRLLDSAWYRTLIPGSMFIDNAGWTQMPDGSVRVPGIK